MKKSHVFILCFMAGSILYPIIELIYRNRTHFSMGILGGICLCTVCFVHFALGEGNLLLKSLCSALLITQLEFICGAIVNLGMKLSVWDYSDQPLNVAGQICPLFSFYWFLLSLAAHFVFEKIPRFRAII